jgi:hypothetical protein
MKFEVEFVYRHESGSYLFARHLETGHFTLSASSRLGGVPIQPWLSQPRKFKPDGSPDLDVFAFVLTNRLDADKFSVGQIVELEA